jgi:hypothetical protein
MCKIKTKTHDGGSSNAISSEANVNAPGSSAKPDAFSVYSNQEIRMNRLLGREDGPPIQNNDTGSSAPTSSETHTADAAIDRKTRLSWELHTSLLTEDDTRSIPIPDER